MNIEYISVPLQLKALETGEFEGYGSTFGNVDLGGDVVMNGAFSKSLKQYRKEGDWPQMFWMHRPDQIPGKWLDMSEDEKGLWMKGILLPTTIGNDVKVLMKAKAVKALSIGFSIDSPDDFEYRDGVRLIHQVNLWEVSPVSMPMNPKARISAVKARLHAEGKSLTDVKRELEQFFRSRNFSKSEAVTFASRALAPDEMFGAMPNLDVSNDKSGAIPDSSRRDAVEQEAIDFLAAKSRPDETSDEDIARAIEQAGEEILAGMIRSKFRVS